MYGTLLSGFKNSFARMLRQEARLEGIATVPGKLYDLGSYPGLVLAEAGAHQVVGEVYELSSRAERILRNLDYYEGAEYERVVAEARSADWVQAVWIYHYLGPVTEKSWIESGDYKLYLAQLNNPEK